jgi:hypothetical protein
MMNRATLVKWIRDPRSGEVHLPSEEVTSTRVIRNLDRALMKVRWQAGGDCVVFPEQLAEVVNQLRFRKPPLSARGK